MSAASDTPIHPWRGLGVALVTPFTSDHKVDLLALKKVVDHVTTGGVDYLVAMGTTGESVTLNQQERYQALDLICTVNEGRKPILLGVGGNDTRAVLEQLKQDCKRFYVQGILSVCPAYNRPSQEGLFQHFSALAQASPLPIMLYNVPSRTASNLLPATVVRLAQAHSNIIAIKEASGSLEQGACILREAPAGFAVVAGDDLMALPGMALGYQGVVSVAANAVPERMARLTHSALADDYATARKEHLDLVPLIQLLFAEGNPTGVKALLHAKGLCQPDVRLPLVKATEGLEKQLSAWA